MNANREKKGTRGTLLNLRLVEGPGVVLLRTNDLAAGVYLVELRMQGAALAQSKMIVQP